jgi:hypothetical protein
MPNPASAGLTSMGSKSPASAAMAGGRPKGPVRSNEEIRESARIRQQKSRAERGGKLKEVVETGRIEAAELPKENEAVITPRSDVSVQERNYQKRQSKAEAERAAQGVRWDLEEQANKLLNPNYKPRKPEDDLFPKGYFDAPRNQMSDYEYDLIHEAQARSPTANYKPEADSRAGGRGKRLFGVVVLKMKQDGPKEDGRGKLTKQEKRQVNIIDHLERGQPYGLPGDFMRVDEVPGSGNLVNPPLTPGVFTSKARVLPGSGPKGQLIKGTGKPGGRPGVAIEGTKRHLNEDGGAMRSDVGVSSETIKTPDEYLSSALGKAYRDAKAGRVVESQEKQVDYQNDFSPVRGAVNLIDDPEAHFDPKHGQGYSQGATDDPKAARTVKGDVSPKDYAKLRDRNPEIREIEGRLNKAQDRFNEISQQLSSARDSQVGEAFRSTLETLDQERVAVKGQFQKDLALLKTTAINVRGMALLKEKAQRTLKTAGVSATADNALDVLQNAGLGKDLQDNVLGTILESIRNPGSPGRRVGSVARTDDRQWWDHAKGVVLPGEEYVEQPRPQSAISTKEYDAKPKHPLDPNTITMTKVELARASEPIPILSSELDHREAQSDSGQNDMDSTDARALEGSGALQRAVAAGRKSRRGVKVNQDYRDKSVAKLAEKAKLFFGNRTPSNEEYLRWFENFQGGADQGAEGKPFKRTESKFTRESQTPRPVPRAELRVTNRNHPDFTGSDLTSFGNVSAEEEIVRLLDKYLPNRRKSSEFDTLKDYNDYIASELYGRQERPVISQKAEGGEGPVEPLYKPDEVSQEALKRYESEDSLVQVLNDAQKMARQKRLKAEAEKTKPLRSGMPSIEDFLLRIFAQPSS